MVILKVTHITKTRAIHTVNSAVLYGLLKEAYEEEMNKAVELIPLHEWIEKKCKSNPTFKYWILVLDLEILLLSYVRSIRTSNFALSKERL